MSRQYTFENKFRPTIMVLDQKAEEFIGGPYQVERRKVYKPIFLCFIDLIFAITLIIGSILFHWFKLDS